MLQFWLIFVKKTITDGSSARMFYNYIKCNILNKYENIFALWFEKK